MANKATTTFKLTVRSKRGVRDMEHPDGWHAHFKLMEGTSLVLDLGAGLNLDSAYRPVLCLMIAGVLSGHEVNLMDFALPADMRHPLGCLAIALADEIRRLREAEASKASKAAEAAEAAEAVEVEGPRGGMEKAIWEAVQKLGTRTAVFMETVRIAHCRTAGAEKVSLDAVLRSGLPDFLAGQGDSPKQVKLSLVQVIGRMICPGSELATMRWAVKHSILPKMIGLRLPPKTDLRSAMCLHRSSDGIYGHRHALAGFIRDFRPSVPAVPGVPGIDGAILSIHDLDATNFPITGTAANIAEARFGRSKAGKSNHRQVSLAIVADRQGYIRWFKYLPGNVSEPGIFKDVLAGLKPAKGDFLVSDAGFSTRRNLATLDEAGLYYVATSRGRGRVFDRSLAYELKTDGGDTVWMYLEGVEDGVSVYRCLSEATERHENDIMDRRTAKYMEDMRKLSDSLPKKRKGNDLRTIGMLAGRVKERHRSTAQHFEVTFVTEPATGKAPERVVSLKVEPRPVEGSMATHAGVYTLRTNKEGLPMETVLRLYMGHCKVEESFRCMKTGLDPNPFYHQISRRVEAQMLISVLAYQHVTDIRNRLKARGIHFEWPRIRTTLSTLMSSESYALTVDNKLVSRELETDMDADVKMILSALGLSTVSMSGKVVYVLIPEYAWLRNLGVTVAGGLSL
jgi:hypothetical protein